MFIRKVATIIKKRALIMKMFYYPIISSKRDVMSFILHCYIKVYEKVQDWHFSCMTSINLYLNLAAECIKFILVFKEENCLFCIVQLFFQLLLLLCWICFYHANKVKYLCLIYIFDFKKEQMTFSFHHLCARERKRNKHTWPFIIHFC